MQDTRRPRRELNFPQHEKGLRAPKALALTSRVYRIFGSINDPRYWSTGSGSITPGKGDNMNHFT